MKVELKKSERFEYWFGMIALLGVFYSIAVFALVAALQEGSVPHVSVAITAFALWTSYRYWGLRNMLSFEIKITPEQFKEANKATAILGDWNILSNTNKKFTARIGHLFLWEGLRVTAIHTKEGIHVNCMPTPSSRSHPFAWRSAKIYVQALHEAYKSVATQEVNLVDLAESKRDKKEQEFLASAEWTLGRTIARIALYSFFLVMILASVHGISNGELAGMFTLVIVGSLIFMDIRILIKKRKHKKKNS